MLSGLIVTLGTVPPAAVQPVPPALASLVHRAGVDDSIVDWCAGEFRPGARGEYAVALGAANGLGRYVVIESDATVTELAPFKDGPALRCFTPSEARKQSSTIRHSETIEGEIVPRWRTTVVCTFVENTSATCWQYSPVERAFVKVGWWTT